MTNCLTEQQLEQIKDRCDKSFYARYKTDVSALLAHVAYQQARMDELEDVFLPDEQPWDYLRCPKCGAREGEEIEGGVPVRSRIQPREGI